MGVLGNEMRRVIFDIENTDLERLGVALE